MINKRNMTENESTIQKIYYDTNHDARFESMRKNTRSARVLRRHEDLRKRCEKEVRTYERWQKLAAAELRQTQVKYQTKLQKIHLSLKSPYIPRHKDVDAREETLVRNVTEAVPHYVRSSAIEDDPSVDTGVVLRESDVLPDTDRSCSYVDPSRKDSSLRLGSGRLTSENSFSPRMEAIVESLRLTLCSASNSARSSDSSFTPRSDRSCHRLDRGDSMLSAGMLSAGMLSADRSFTPRSDRACQRNARGDSRLSAGSSTTPKSNRTNHHTDREDSVLSAGRINTPRCIRESDSGNTHRSPRRKHSATNSLRDSVRQSRTNLPLVEHSSSMSATSTTQAATRATDGRSATRVSGLFDCSHPVELVEVTDLPPQRKLLYTPRKDRSTETYSKKSKVVTFKV